jgi:hypothetical protein
MSGARYKVALLIASGIFLLGTAQTGIAEQVGATTGTNLGNAGGDNAPTGPNSILDSFRRGDPTGNLALLKDALDSEVRNRDLMPESVPLILDGVVAWIDHMRDLQGDPVSLRVALSLDPAQVSDRDMKTLARLLNLPPATPSMPELAPELPIAQASSTPQAAKASRRRLEKAADQAFNQLSQTVATDPALASETGTSAAAIPDEREWSASGAPRLRRTPASITGP